MQTINNVEVKENSLQVKEVEWAQFWTAHIINDAGNSDLPSFDMVTGPQNLL